MLRRLSFLFIAASLLVQVAASEPEVDITASPPPKGLPAVAGWGFYQAYPSAWKSTFKSQVTRSQQGGIPILFIGDSITQGWAQAGKDEWDKRYAPMGAVNYGIGGDSTRQVLWRLDHGLVAGLTPKLIVLKIGTNNLYDDGNGGSDDEIADGIKAVVNSLRSKVPHATVLILGLLPRQNDWFCGRVQRINAATAGLADGQKVRYTDMTTTFLAAPGKVHPELYDNDQLHLSTKGYQAWAETMAPLFTQLTQ